MNKRCGRQLLTLAVAATTPIRLAQVILLAGLIDVHPTGANPGLRQRVCVVAGPTGAVNTERTMDNRTSRLAFLVLLLNITLALLGALAFAWGPAARRPLAPAEGPHRFPDLARVEVLSTFHG